MDQNLKLTPYNIFIGAYINDPIQGTITTIKEIDGDLIKVKGGIRFRKLDQFSHIQLRVVDLVTRFGFELTHLFNKGQYFLHQEYSTIVYFDGKDKFYLELPNNKQKQIHTFADLQNFIINNTYSILNKEEDILLNLSQLEDLLLRNKYLVHHLHFVKEQVRNLEIFNKALQEAINRKNEILVKKISKQVIKSKIKKTYENPIKRKSNTKTSKKR